MYTKDAATWNLLICLVALAALLALPMWTQDTSADSNMQILREKIRADKKLLVASNMSLTEDEAKVFWPIFDAYQNRLQQLNDRLATVILRYAAAYNSNTLTDDEARQLIDEAIAIEEEEARLRKSCSAELAKALPGKKAARYLQIEMKIRAVERYELAAQIPLVK